MPSIEVGSGSKRKKRLSGEQESPASPPKHQAVEAPLDSESEFEFESDEESDFVPKRRSFSLVPVAESARACSD